MLDFSFGEMLVIAIIAIVFLGPDKLPQAFINLAKFFKSIKKIINDAKETIDKEIRIDEIRKEAIEYKKKFYEESENIKNDVKKDINFDLDNLNNILYDEKINTDFDKNHILDINNKQPINIKKRIKRNIKEEVVTKTIKNLKPKTIKKNSNNPDDKKNTIVNPKSKSSKKLKTKINNVENNNV